MTTLLFRALYLTQARSPACGIHKSVFHKRRNVRLTPQPHTLRSRTHLSPCIMLL